MDVKNGLSNTGNFCRTFPWIVDIYNLSPFYFYKVIEVLIRAEEGLSRDVVKHLNHVRCAKLLCLLSKYLCAVWLKNLYGNQYCNVDF